MARLGDIATYVNGYAFKPSDWSDIGLPIIRIQDLTGNSYQANRYNGEYDKRYEIHDGDVLISWSASLGVYVWTGEKAVLNQHIFKVVFNKVEVDKSFFVHQVRNMLENAASQAHGATMKHLTKPVFDALPFNLPSVVEQQRISSVLDKLTNLISLRKQQLAKLDELVKARFVEMFGDLSINSMGWEFQKLSSLCDVRDGTHDSPEYQNEGYPLLTSKNFSSGIIDFSDCNLICEEDFEMINRRSKVDYGDIIMPMIGTIGHPVIVDTDRPFAIKNVALIKFNNKEISNIFVKTVLDSDYFLNVTTANNRGGTQKFIALGDIRNIPIPIVPKELQIEFADFVKEVDRQKLTIQQSLDKLEVLRKSLMQEYFG